MIFYFQGCGDPAAQELAYIVAGARTDPCPSSRARIVRVSPRRWVNIQLELGVDNQHVRYETEADKAGAPVKMVFPMAGVLVAIEADPAMPFEQGEIL